ncbi:MAG: helix-turn-helix domain-containing protein [Vicinamibacterales bacterium]
MTTDHSPQEARRRFAARMKHERERRGIALRSIAESTKVGTYVFAGLEAHDFSRWPSGAVYRRGFVRDYAQSIGLPGEETLAEFERLFPELLDEGQPPEPAVRDEAGERLRLALAGRARAIPAWSPLRAAGAGFDVVTVLVVASFAAWTSGLGFGLTLGVVAFCYYSLGTVILGRSLWAWWLTDGALRVAEPRAPAPRMTHMTEVGR